LSNLCQVCNQNDFKFRCCDCFHRPLTCTSCCAEGHMHVPFHAVEVWNGSCFLPSNLLHTGLITHLGHGGSWCPMNNMGGKSPDDDVESDTSGTSVLQIIHSNGICQRRIRYCKCPNAPPHHIQLLQHQLFPASYQKPQTAFTFDVLDHFHIQAMECKTPAGAFYSKLKRLTCNAFPDTIPVSISLSFLFVFLRH
jgi:hypothetical protein